MVIIASQVKIRCNRFSFYIKCLFCCTSVLTNGFQHSPICPLSAVVRSVCVSDCSLVAPSPDPSVKSLGSSHHVFMKASQFRGMLSLWKNYLQLTAGGEVTHIITVIVVIACPCEILNFYIFLETSGGDEYSKWTKSGGKRLLPVTKW